MIRWIGPYEIIEKVGEGGMGIVYKARHPRLNRVVAVKTIKGAQDQGVEAFIREAGALTKLYHPNLVTIFDFGEFEEEGAKKPYLVMEFLSGRTLSEIIKKKEELSIDRKLSIIVQACRGLQAAHEAGIIHRDIKPSNLFILTDDFVKIIDFGIARESSAEVTHAVKGTPYYMSPEQIHGKEATTPRSDIFALGVVCYELLVYERPFTGRTAEEIWGLICSNFSPRPIKEIDPTIDDPICKVVEKAMAKDARKRFATTREMADLLEKIRRGEYIEIFDDEKILGRVRRAKIAAENGNFHVAESIVEDLRWGGFYSKEIDQLEESIQRLKDDFQVVQRMKTANDLVKEEEYEPALKKLNEILELSPGHAQALALIVEVKEKILQQEMRGWLRRAKDEIDRNNFTQAAEWINKVTRLDPQNQEAKNLSSYLEEARRLRAVKNKLFAESKQRFEEGAIDAALEKVQELIELDDTNTEYKKLYNRVNAEKAKLDDITGILAAAEKEPALEKKMSLITEGLKKYPGDKMLSEKAGEIRERQQQIDAFKREQVALANEHIRNRNFGPARQVVLKALEAIPQDSGLEALLRTIEEKIKKETEAAQLKTTGREQLKAGRYTDAIILFDEALKINPSDSEVIELRGEAKRQKERRDRAQIIGTQIKQAQDLIQGKNIALAEQIVELLVKLDSENPEVQALLDTITSYRKEEAKEKYVAEKLSQASALISARNFDQAEQVLEKAASEYSDVRISSLLEEVRREKEILELKRYKEQTLRELDRLMAANKYSEAQRLTDEALARHPADTDLVARQAAIEKGLKEKAAREEREKFVEGLVGQARTLMAKDELDKAMAVLRPTLDSDPNHPALLKCVREVEARRGAIERAIAEAVTKVDGLWREERFTEAKSVLQKVCAQYPTRLELRDLLRDVQAAEAKFIETTTTTVKNLVGAGKPKEALKEIEKLIAAHPNEAWLRELKKEARTGWLTIKKSEINKFRSEGQLEDARKSLDETFTQYPDDPELKNIEQQIQQDIEKQRRQAAKRKEEEERLAEQKRREFKREQIELANQHLKNGALDPARRVVINALQSLPKDKDLEALLRTIEARIKRESEAAQLKSAGRERLKAGRYTDAVNLFDEALKINSADEEAIRLREEAVRLREEAVRLREEAKRQKESQEQARLINTLLKQAQDLMKRNQVTAAEPMVEHLQTLDPQHPEVQALVEAIRSYKKEQTQERYVADKLSEATFLAQRGNYAAAEKALEEALATHPDARLASRLEEIKREKEVVELRKYKEQVLQRLARLTEDRRYPEAQNLALEALTRCPEDKEIVAKLVEIKEGSIEETRSKQKAEFVEERIRQAQGLASKNEIDRAIFLVRQGLDSYPDDPTLLTYVRGLETKKEAIEQGIKQATAKAEGLRREKQFTNAKAVLRKAIAQHPGRQELTELLSDVEAAEVQFIDETKRRMNNLFLVERTKEALDEIEALVAVHPNEPWLKELEEEARTKGLTLNKAELKKLLVEEKAEEAQRLLEVTITQYPSDEELKTIEQRIKEIEKRQRPVEPRPPKPKPPVGKWVTLGAAVVAITVVIYFLVLSKGVIIVKVETPGTDVTLDGRLLKPAGSGEFKEENLYTWKKYTLEFRKDGYEPQSKSVTLQWRTPTIVGPIKLQPLKASLTIWVKARGTGTPIPGADVFIEGLDNELKKEKLSEVAPGQFKREDLVPGNYKVSAHKSGYYDPTPKTQEVKFGSSPATVELDEQKPGVAVLDITSNVRDFDLDIEKDGRPYRKEHVSSDEKRLDGLEAGVYKVTWTNAKYGKKTDSRTLRGGHSDHIEFKITTIISITVTSTGSGNPPIANADIKIKGEKKSKRTDTQGKVSVEVLAEKPCIIVVESTGFKKREYPFTPIPEVKSIPITLDPDIQPPAYATLTIDQKELADAEVILENKSNPSIRWRERIQPNGKLQRDIPSGEYNLTIEKEGFEPYPYGSVELSPGQKFPLPRIPNLEEQKGIVVFNIDPPGSSVTFTKIGEANSQNLDPSREQRIPPGRYNVKTSHEDCLDDNQSLELKRGEKRTFTAKLISKPRSRFNGLSSFIKPGDDWKLASERNTYEIKGEGIGLLKGYNNFEKYYMTLSFHINDKNSSVYLIFHAHKNNYMLLQVYKNNVSLIEVDNGKEKPLKNWSLDSPLSVADRAWYDVDVKVYGSCVAWQLFEGGRPIGRNHHPIKDGSGNVGIRAKANDSFKINLFHLKELDDPNPCSNHP